MLEDDKTMEDDIPPEGDKEEIDNIQSMPRLQCDKEELLQPTAMLEKRKEKKGSKILTPNKRSTRLPGF